MSDREVIIASEVVMKDTRLIPLLKELIVCWSKLIWRIIRAYTIGLPARIRLYLWKRYFRRCQQSGGKA